MAKDVRFAAKSATIGGTAIVSLTGFSIHASSTIVTDQGAAGTPGPVDEQVTDRDLTVTVRMQDYLEALALVEKPPANLVGTYLSTGGATKTVTMKNVYFNTPPQEILFPEKDVGGKVPTCQITGRAMWGPSDTFSTMVTTSA